MPLQEDKNAQAWMSTQASEMLRKKRTEEAQSAESQIKALHKRQVSFSNFFIDGREFLNFSHPKTTKVGQKWSHQ